jgi:hypothetical protein
MTGVRMVREDVTRGAPGIVTPPRTSLLEPTGAFPYIAPPFPRAVTHRGLPFLPVPSSCWSC